MVQNYYALKREASQIIKDTMQYLEANPDRYVPLVKLTIEFQQRFGFGERILNNMLKPFIELKEVEIIKGALHHVRQTTI